MKLVPSHSMRQGHLRLIRGSDMLKIDLPPPDLAVYGQHERTFNGADCIGLHPTLNMEEKAGQTLDDNVSKGG